MAKPMLDQSEVAAVIADLAMAAAKLNAVYPGEASDRQPVHTVYGGAQLFKADSAAKIGRIALSTFNDHISDARELAVLLELPGASTLPTTLASLQRAEEQLRTDSEGLRRASPSLWLALAVYHRVRSKLESEGVEDFRIDFEDGFGLRPNAEEDAEALRAAQETALGMKNQSLPPFFGIRIKSLNEETRQRSLATLEIYLGELLARSGGILPSNFVVTLPKITSIEQISALARMMEMIEKAGRLPSGSLRMELMVEATQTLFDSDGRLVMSHFYRAAGGRLIGVHFGVYDYTASCQIVAAYQSMDHASCDFARHLMQVAFAGQPVRLSDGATNVMPVGPHKAGVNAPLTKTQEAENTQAVHRAWKLGFDNTRRSLRHGFYQGWDLHPNQLPMRYAACYSFFLEGLDAATERLKSFMAKAAQATLLGEVFDDAATGQGLLNFFLRGVNCGAVTKDEVLKTGLSWDDIMTRSFLKILDRRRAQK